MTMAIKQLLNKPIEAQLSSIFGFKESDHSQKIETEKFTKQRKNSSSKRNNKRNFAADTKNLNTLKSPSQIEVSYLLENYENKRFDLVENLAQQLIQKYPDHQLSLVVLGSVFKQTGRYQESLVTDQKWASLSPGDAEVHSNLGDTLRELGRLIEAVASYEKAIAVKPDYSEVHYKIGNTLKELGRLEDAAVSYKKSIEIDSCFAESYSNLGITLAELGRLKESVANYEKAIAIKPDYAEAHNNLGVTLRKLGRQKEAESCYRKAIFINPSYAQAHFNLGNTLKELGSLEDALGNYEIAISIDPSFSEKCEHMIATITGHTPLRANDTYVAELFDNYAKNFDSSLVDKLNYKTPTIIAGYLKPLITSENTKLDILDLGCGTGLAGEALIDSAKNLVGIDLSKEMLKLASAKNIYKRLVQSEIHHAIRNEQDESFDVVVSSDVFVYIGDLKDIFEGVYNILRVGGFFAYSVEALYPIGSTEKCFHYHDYQLNDSGRYSHSSNYLISLIDTKQFTLHTMKLEQIRLENGQPVMGYVVVMKKTS